MLNVILLSVIMLNANAKGHYAVFIMLNVIMLNIIMVNVIMLNAI
jgi:hypothetical protein